MKQEEAKPAEATVPVVAPIAAPIVEPTIAPIVAPVAEAPKEEVKPVEVAPTNPV